ncbi:restriction endonuclease subunit S [Pseudomonas guariconensis]|uniref:restriction endonuclease subunit S n=1 Tax=Pseudomonas guariconensis TaxID=1288410 RepID=UPI00209AF957|nr:restriction endonuclease subunit S [Pseudomonas guariconensis]MCO7631209.1 restriction endonuclease subunit S [Pseudomonas guariconensis]
MSELPMGWAAATLNDLLGAGGLFSDGDWVESKDQDPDGQNRLLQLADIGDGFFVDKSSRFVNDEKFSSLNCTEVKEGDVLIARMPDPLGRACLMPAIPQRCLTVVDVAVFRVGETGVSNKWLMHFLNSSPVRLEIELNSSGTTRKRISRGKLGEILLPVPPLAEQNRIAAKLDELLAQVNTLKARIDAIPALLKRFRQSVLAAAVSGRLTEDWRVQHSLAEWRISTFGDEGAVSGGLTKNAKRSELTLEKPYLRVANVYANKLSLGDVTHIGLTDKEFKKTRLIAGDILIVEGNGSLEHIGRAAIWNDEIPDCSHQNHLIRWRPIGGMQPKFALYQLLSPQGRKQLVEVAKSTTGLHTLSITKVSALALPVPEEDEQIEIVRRVEQLFTFADQLEAKVASAKSRIDHLTQSILAKAFRGELVPQDPNDEPASVLLQRIKAQRAAAPKAKRGRKASA